MHCCAGLNLIRKLHVAPVPCTLGLSSLLPWAGPCSCIRDDFYGARDTLLMSRIQEQTGQLDAKMQVGPGLPCCWPDLQAYLRCADYNTYLSAAGLTCGHTCADFTICLHAAGTVQSDHCAAGSVCLPRGPHF